MFERAKIINRQTNKNKSMHLTKSKLLGLLIATILLTSLISYVAFSNPDLDYTTTVMEGSMNIGVSYVVFRDSSTYYARSGESGVVTSSTNATYLITYCIDNADNGTVLLQKAYYDLDSPIVITQSVKLLGSGHSEYPNEINEAQAYYPTHLTGTVFRTSAAINVIDIQNVVNVVIKDLAIEFTGASTGHGIYVNNPDSPTGYTSGLIWGTFENIHVLDNDGDHYAFWFENIQHLNCELLRNHGGAFICIRGNDYSVQHGNSVFNELYGYNYLATSVPVVNIDTIGDWAGNWTNLITFNRLQVNSWHTTNAPSILNITRSRLMTFIGLNLEIDTSINNIIIFNDHSSYITFLNPYLHGEHAGSIVWSDSDCSRITFIDGDFGVKNVELQGEGNSLINPHWTTGYRPVFAASHTTVLFINYTIATTHAWHDLSVGAGVSHLDILFNVTPYLNQPDAKYGVLACTNWNTTVYYSNKQTTGVRINFGTVAPESATLDVWLFRDIK